MKVEIGDLTNILGFLEARSQGRPADPSHLHLSYTLKPTKDAAWRTATATGVLSYMDYARVQSFAAVYHGQDVLELLSRETLNAYIQLESYIVTGFDPSALSQEDIKTAMPQVRQALADLGAMRDYNRSLISQYAEALK